MNNALSRVLLFMVVLVSAASMCPAGNVAFSAEHTVLGQSGNWKIMGTVDEFTDVRTCVIIFEDDWSVLVDVDPGGPIFSWNLERRGGVASYKYRIDDNLASQLILASAIEKKTSTIIIIGTVFNELLNSKKFRIQVTTDFKNVLTLTLDTSGLKSAYEGMLKQCPNG
jgi:hypothetical protein